VDCARRDAIIAEVFTTGFVLLWFGIGALVAAFVGLLGAGYLLQFFTFFFVSLILTALSKTIFNKYFTAKGQPNSKPVWILCRENRISRRTSQGALGEGAVKVFGSTWTAYPQKVKRRFNSPNRWSWKACAAQAYMCDV
jgi:membrane protein implicated in regulation of membrane protease activity